MQVFELPEIRRALNYPDAIQRMRDALVALSRGECETPMPMHLDIVRESAEVHIKSSYRRGGRYFALKIASSFPGNTAGGLSTGNGMVLLCSADTGAPIAVLADEGWLTDIRTAAAAAMVARELKRADTSLGILGAGIQARLQARLHAEVLRLETIWIWGRNPDRAEACRADIERMLPNACVRLAPTPSAAAQNATLIVTATASREPLLSLNELQPGTHISAVGSDSPGKQEIDPAILRHAALILADSRPQCEKLGELQHAPDQWERAIEIGAFCESGAEWDRGGITVCDYTGVGVEDLYIAEYCWERLAAHKETNA